MQRPSAVEIAKQHVLGTVRDRPDCGRHPAAGLQRGVEQHAERHDLRVVLIEVPGVVGNVVFADDLHACLAVVEVAEDLGHAADEVIRLT